MASLRARFKRWFKPPRKFRLTREGKWFIGATLVLGFAAVNGGINLLFLVFGMLLCLLVANGVLAEAAMRRLDPHRQLPHAIYAGSPFLMGIAVRNHKKRVAPSPLKSKISRPTAIPWIGAASSSRSRPAAGKRPRTGAR